MSRALSSVRTFIASRGPAQREALLFALCLLVGVLVLPFAIWLVGSLVLGPYANGGAFALLGDFLAGLGGGSAVYWGVALAPWLLILFTRGLLSLLRRTA